MKELGEKKEKKCSFKCCTCEYYNSKNDFCKEKEIENVTKQPHTDFSVCDKFLVREDLIMF